MDELHRRMTIEVCLFATTATLFCFALFHSLANAGLMQMIQKIGLDLHTWWGTTFILVWFYIIGSRILHRRYK